MSSRRLFEQNTCHQEGCSNKTHVIKKVVKGYVYIQVVYMSIKQYACLRILKCYTCNDIVDMQFDDNILIGACITQMTSILCCFINIP